MGDYSAFFFNTTVQRPPGFEPRRPSAPGVLIGQPRPKPPSQSKKSRKTASYLLSTTSSNTSTTSNTPNTTYTSYTSTLTTTPSHTSKSINPLPTGLEPTTSHGGSAEGSCGGASLLPTRTRTMSHDSGALYFEQMLAVPLEPHKPKDRSHTHPQGGSVGPGRKTSMATSRTSVDRTSSRFGHGPLGLPQLQQQPPQQQHGETRSLATSPLIRGDGLMRSASISSTTGSSHLTTMTSADPPPVDDLGGQPFARRNGRRYLRDRTLPYPLPCDLAEIHRQILRTMLMCQVFNGPICSPAFDTTPPRRVLDVGCGSGFWSVMCHRHFKQRGCSSISFTGIDMAPLAPGMETDDDMSWRFLQHDLRRLPLPFSDDEFNLVMIKDLSMVVSNAKLPQALMDEYLRILKPGGTLEIWDGDHSLRMLLPQAAQSQPTRSYGDHESESESDEDGRDRLFTDAMGIYELTPQTPLTAPQNHFLSDYNSWVTKALEARGLTSMPCTLYRPYLLQEPDLSEIDYRRLGIPLGEVRWEREGVGPPATPSETHAFVYPPVPQNKGKGKAVGSVPSTPIAYGGAGEAGRKVLTQGQAALRRTALMTVIQMIESLEPVLREASGKGQDEWDRWHANMMNDLLKQNGTSWGEVLEVGAWWARKKKGGTRGKRDMKG